jgi:hypothetical protein
VAGRQLHRLSALRVAKEVVPDHYADGGGLYMQIADSGARSWLSGPAEVRTDLPVRRGGRDGQRVTPRLILEIHLGPAPKRHYGLIRNSMEAGALMRGGYVGGLETKCAPLIGILTFVRPGGLRRAERVGDRSRSRGMAYPDCQDEDESTAYRATFEVTGPGIWRANGTYQEPMNVPGRMGRGYERAESEGKEDKGICAMD